MNQSILDCVSNGLIYLCEIEKGPKAKLVLAAALRTFSDYRETLKRDEPVTPPMPPAFKAMWDERFRNDLFHVGDVDGRAVFMGADGKCQAWSAETGWAARPPPGFWETFAAKEGKA